MISISTLVPATPGNIVLKNHSGSNLKNKPFRVSRIKTLDGGCYINHSGYTDGDRTLLIKSDKITKAQEAALDTMAELYTSLLFSMEDGIYLGTISNLKAANGNLNMTIYLEQKEN